MTFHPWHMLKADELQAQEADKMISVMGHVGSLSLMPGLGTRTWTDLASAVRTVPAYFLCPVISRTL